MRVKKLLAAAAVIGIATALSVPAAGTAQAADHDHPANVFELDVIDHPTAADTAATEAIDATDIGINQKGTTYPPDVDGYVPTQYGGDCYDGVLAYATWVSVGDWYIVYDKCEMERYGAGQTDWDRVGAHEYAHTEGWGHYEEPRALNAAFEPGIAICGC